MKDVGDEATGTHIGLHDQTPALQVICLGSGGGPCEDNVTAFLVRSIGSAWAKGSLLAVDAGSHFAPITRILERDFPRVSADRRRTRSSTRHESHGNPLPRPGQSRAYPPSSSPTSDEDEPPKPEPTLLHSGPFSGLTLPNESARANALHILRTYISTYLITHPHLDHISGFTINTAAFHATSRPKTLAALPSTVDAIKRYIFNDVIWPNLSDEDGGVGFVTFQRLKEGGDVMVGEGEGRGYIDVCDGLGVRAFKISHGVCTKSPPSHHHRGSISGLTDQQPPYNGSILGSSQDPASTPMGRARSVSGLGQYSSPGTPGLTSRPAYFATQPSPQLSSMESQCVVDSTAYFIRDFDTQREVLIFGDVEADSISLSPRNYVVWQEAARKIAYGLLGAIFIECSYDDSQADAVLFGHLNPRHLIAELQTLAVLVSEAKHMRQLEKGIKKRKRSGPNGLDNFARQFQTETDVTKRRSIAAPGPAAAVSGRPIPAIASASVRHPSTASDQSMPDIFSRSNSTIVSDSATDPSVQLPRPLDPSGSPRSMSIPPPIPITATVSPTIPPLAANSDSARESPLAGLRVVIMHVKDTLRDGPHVGDTILSQLRAHELRLQEIGQGLGCDFVISQSGESYYA